MNNDEFKKFLQPFVAEAIAGSGGRDRVRMLNETIGMVGFVAGWVCGRAASVVATQRPRWNETLLDSPTIYTIEETRRVYDYVRLVIETGSVTS